MLRNLGVKDGDSRQGPAPTEQREAGRQIDPNGKARSLRLESALLDWLVLSRISRPFPTNLYHLPLRLKSAILRFRFSRLHFFNHLVHPFLPSINISRCARVRRNAVPVGFIMDLDIRP